MHAQRRPAGPVVVAIVAFVAALAGGGVAVAGDQVFSDVGPTHPFRAEIEAIAEAGITTGFTDGTYRPGGAVSRGAMAAFMGRGFGRAAFDSDVDTNPAPADDVLTVGANVQMTGGSAGADTGGYVVVIGSARLESPAAQCPCSLSGRIRDVTGGLQSGTQLAVVDESVPNAETTTGTSWTISQVMALPEGQTHTYDVQYELATDGSNGNPLLVSTAISVIYVPFDGTGNVPDA